MRTLVAGWFSFVDGHATAGDLLSRDLTCDWLQSAGFDYDVANAPPLTGGVDLATVDPVRYSHLVFVCGPFQKGELEATLFSRFAHCRLIGLNLSMEISLSEWNPFDFLIERDSNLCVHPDIVFLSRRPLVPVVGICLVESYRGAMTEAANDAIDRLRSSREMASVSVDTRLDFNSSGLRSPAEIESILARMDLVITTRLHGTVLALKNGVPVISIDPMAGGAKIRRQMELIGWPIVFDADTVTDDGLKKAYDYCLTEPARTQARDCARRAGLGVENTRAKFIHLLKSPAELEKSYSARRSAPPDDRWMTPFLNPPSEDLRQPIPARRSLRSRVARLLRRH